MKINDNIYMLEIKAEILGKPEIIYPTLIKDTNSLTLVDCGYPGQYELIKQAIEQENLSLNNLKNIIITHHDIDHIGSLKEIKTHYPEAKIISHEEEKPYIQGETTPLKISKAEALGDQIPPQMKQFINMLKGLYPKLTCKVDKTFQDQEEITIGNGTLIIHTPGHTHGHICLYHKPSKTLISGDALTIKDNKIQEPIPSYTHNPAQSKESLSKLTGLEIQNLISYHEGLFHPNI